MENVKYIPGDLVTYRGIVFQVDTNSSHSPFIVLTKDNESDPNKYYVVETEAFKVKDIPLTPEILEKNGWTKELHWDNYYWCLDIDDYTKIGISFNQDGVINSGFITEDPYERDMDAFTAMPNLRYVHQVQHLLFGLRLDSNLKL